MILTALSFFITPHSFAESTQAPNLRSQITGQVRAGNAVAGLGDAAPQALAARIIQIILSVVGITFTALIVFSGYNLLTAAGDESKVETAKKTIQACVIGLAITLGAYSLTTFLGKSAVQITTQDAQSPVDDRLDFDRLRNDIQNSDAGIDVDEASGSSL